MGYPAYQCFKTTDRDVYCSSVKVSNHTEGAAWVSNCMAFYSIQGSQLKGKPYLEDSQPDNATNYP